ncbi:MAG: hypothetical protein ACXWVG_11855 [Telluria sp.]
MRRLICILLLLCLPLQSFAMHGGALAFGSDADLVHDAAHDDRIEHHHDTDGSIHFDDSDESAQHVQDHSHSPHAVDIILAKLPAAPEQLVSVLKAEFSRFIPELFLDSPLRPPSPALGHAAEGHQHA